MFQMHRVFCATSWDLEKERRAFYGVIGEFNESEAMRLGHLYVPVSLLGVQEKRAFQSTIDENVYACRHFLLVLEEDWGPPSRNFQRDYQLALRCSADPTQPMREVAFLFRRPLEGGAPEGRAPEGRAPEGGSLPATLPAPDGVFSATAEFNVLLRTLLTQWLASLRAETGSGSSSASA